MFEQFTARAQQILKIFAQEEAKRLNNDVLLPEHIFLGILREGEGIASKILMSFDFDIDALKEEVEMTLPKGANTLLIGDLPLSNSAKDVIKLAIEEAKELEYNKIGTELLLLGILLEENNQAAQILNSEGIDVDLIRNEILRILGEIYPDDVAHLKHSKKSKTPFLDKFSKDLIALSREQKLDPVIGRNNEIERVIQILSRRTKNNPILIGEPGVGKTAIVEGIALKIAKNTAPNNLLKKRVVMLDLAAMVAGTKYRGEFEERIKNVLRELEKNKNIIIFIDEIHTLIGAGGAEGTLDAANILKPALAKGEIQCIGATTLNEYKKYIEKDAALERRFQMVLVKEPNVEETIAILQGLKSRYEEYHRLKYSDNAIETAARLAYRYISDRFLPDKAIDLIDEAGAKVKIKKADKPLELKLLEKKIENLNLEKKQLVDRQLYELAGRKRDEIKKFIIRHNKLKDKWRKEKSDKILEVTEDDIYRVLSNWTNIPVEKLAETEKEKLLHMDEELKKRIVGQNEAIDIISRAVRRSKARVGDPSRPIGSFVFLGPSGVGKTQLAKSLAKFLFGKEEDLVRLDMSDFMEKHNVSRLIGAPPGYVGYEEGGLLTEKVRRNPYSVILFDEIEKAHPDVFNILLQVLEEGELSDSLGHTVNFKNSIIIMTSNIGAEKLNDASNIGFENSETDINKSYKNIKNSLNKEIKKIFKPEFLNRLDDVIVFKPLSINELRKIVDILLEEVEYRLKLNNINLKLTKTAKDYLIKKGYNKTYGARELKRIIQKEVEDKLAVMILENKISKNNSISITVKGGVINFSISARRKKVTKSFALA